MLLLSLQKIKKNCYFDTRIAVLWFSIEEPRWKLTEAWIVYIDSHARMKKNKRTSSVASLPPWKEEQDINEHTSMKSWTHLTLQKKKKELKREKSLRASFQRVVKMSYIKVFVHWWKSEITPTLHHFKLCLLYHYILQW